MDGFLNNLHSVIDRCMIDAVAEAMQEPEFKVYPEPEGLPPDITAEFRQYKEDIQYFQDKLNAALRVPAEFIINKTRAVGMSDPPTGKLYWLEPKYETQPFELRFKPLKPMELFRKSTSLINF